MHFMSINSLMYIHDIQKILIFSTKLGGLIGENIPEFEGIKKIDFKKQLS